MTFKGLLNLIFLSSQLRQLPLLGPQARNLMFSSTTPVLSLLSDPSRIPVHFTSLVSLGPIPSALSSLPLLYCFYSLMHLLSSNPSTALAQKRHTNIIASTWLLAADPCKNPLREERDTLPSLLLSGGKFPCRSPTLPSP